MLKTNPRGIGHRRNYGSWVVYWIKQILCILALLKNWYGLAHSVTFYFWTSMPTLSLLFRQLIFPHLYYFFVLFCYPALNQVIMRGLCKFHFIPSLYLTETAGPPLHLIKIVIFTWQTTHISAYRNNFALKYSPHNIPQIHCIASQSCGC